MNSRIRFVSELKQVVFFRFTILETGYKRDYLEFSSNLPDKIQIVVAQPIYEKLACKGYPLLIVDAILRVILLTCHCTLHQTSTTFICIQNSQFVTAMCLVILNVLKVNCNPVEV